MFMAHLENLPAHAIDRHHLIAERQDGAHHAGKADALDMRMQPAGTHGDDTAVVRPHHALLAHSSDRGRSFHAMAGAYST
jgi:hypothetical protein